MLGWVCGGAQWQLLALIGQSPATPHSSSHFFGVPVFPSITGFPLDKAVAYSKLRNPFLINDLTMQYYIQDRYSFLWTRGVGDPEMPILGSLLWDEQSQICFIFCIISY